MEIKKAVLIAFIAFLMMTAPQTARCEVNKSFLLDGQLLSYPDQQPIIEAGNILVPLKFTAEKMGLTVEWNGQTQVASICKDENVFGFIPGSMEVTQNKTRLTGWQDMKFINGRIMVPLSLMTDIFGYQVQNNGDKVIITSKPEVITADLSVQKVREKVYVVKHSFPWSCNSLLVEMNNGQLVMIDTPNTPEATHDLLRWIDKKFGDRQVTAFNAHFHFDCLGGNQALAEKNIKIFGSELTAQLIKERGEAVRIQTIGSLIGPENQRYREAYAKIPYIAPTPLSGLDEGRSINFGNEPVEIFYPGEAHAPDNLVFYFPQKKLLYGGCMIMNMEAQKTGNIVDANLKAWPESVQKVIDRYPAAETVIPGHGAWGGRELLLHTLSVLNTTPK